MQNLSELVQTVILSEEETPEDIFASAPGLIFPDDLRNQHGDPGAIIVYHSQSFGPIELTTADPSGETERRLFSHYLWNAGVAMAERISGRRMKDDEEIAQWSVKGEDVLELGAGVGLAGIVSTLAGANSVVMTDYPAPVVLENLHKNVHAVIPDHSSSRASVQGHEWGIFTDDFAKESAGRFSRVLAADCFWMPQVHEELSRSMLHFLSNDPKARVLAIGGFHTGRAKLAGFFDVASEQGLEVVSIYEEDALGNRRPWAKERDGGRENTTERKKWLVIAILRRARQTEAVSG